MTITPLPPIQKNMNIRIAVEECNDRMDPSGLAVETETVG